MSATASRCVAAAEVKASKATTPIVAAPAMNAAASSPSSAAAIMAKTVTQTTSKSFRPSAFAHASAFI